MQARKQAENPQGGGIKAKDERFKKREDFNREIELARTEVREQERRLEKREDTSNKNINPSRRKALLDKERKLHERREVLDKRPRSGGVGRNRRKSCTRSPV